MDVQSLGSLIYFCLSLANDTEIPNLAISPNGTLIASWIRDEVLSMEFLGINKIRLARSRSPDRSALIVSYEEAISFLP